jgi:Ca-activated chloride channel family protein
MKHIVLPIFALSLVVMQHATATGLQPVETSNSVQIESVDFKLEMHGLYVAGLMEIQLTASRGLTNAANLRFPLPPESVLYQAEIFLPAQETWMRAETVGRREGQTIYNEIVNQRYDPLLIQKIGTDFYRARVYPINDKGDFRVRVYYAHVLEATETGYRLRVPFANKDATANNPAEGVKVSLQTDTNSWSASGWQVRDEMGTPSSTIDLSKGAASLSLEDFRMDKDITLDLKPLKPVSAATSLFYQPEVASLKGHLHSWWQPDFSGYHVASAQSRNVVFVIDVSGSMGGDKMVQTRKAVITCLEQLAEGDYFGLVAFDDDVYVFHDTMSPMGDKQAGIKWVTALEAGTRTGMSAALSKGAAIGATSRLKEEGVDLLLVTDGRPNVGSSTVEGMLSDIGNAAEQVGSKIRVFTVGIGEDLDQQLLNGLAQKTGGEATFALADNEITGQILNLFARVRSGGVSQVTASIQGVGLTERADFTWPRLFPGTTLQLAAKGNLADTVTLKLSGMAGKTPLDLSVVPSPLISSSRSNIDLIAAPLAAKVWADALERQIDETGESTELVNNAVRLARTYGIVSRYSSLLALESEKMYAQYGVKRIDRDPAGIALQSVDAPVGNEGQVGGQGTEEGGQPTPTPRPVPPPMPMMTENDSVFAVIVDKGQATTDSTAFSPSMPTTTTVPATAGSSTASGNTYPGSSGPADNEVSATTEKQDSTCDVPVLNEQLRLHIPQLTYDGKYYWADLQLDSLPEGALILKVLNYGEVTRPVTNFSSCKEVILSSQMRIYIPSLQYRLAEKTEKTYTEVILKPLPAMGGKLTFKVFDFRE